MVTTRPRSTSTGKPITRDPWRRRACGEDAKCEEDGHRHSFLRGARLASEDDDAPARSPAEEEDDDDEDKENQNDEESKAARDRRIDELLRAQPKKKSPYAVGVQGQRAAPHQGERPDHGEAREDAKPSARGLGGDADNWETARQALLAVVGLFASHTG